MVMVNKKREINEFFQLYYFYLNFVMFCAICVYWFHVYFNVRIIPHHLVYHTKIVLVSLTILLLKVRITLFFMTIVLIQMKHE